jgi:hypothetical protein
VRSTHQAPQHQTPNLFSTLNMKLPHLTTSLKNGGYLGQMCNTSVDILGKCAIPLWISWANVQYHDGYLGQMCNTTMDILGKCAIPRWISWANVLYTAGLKYWYDYLISYVIKEKSCCKVSDIYYSRDKIGGPCG